MLSALPRHIVSRLPLSQLAISTKKQSHYSSLSYFCKFIYLICQGIIAHHLFIGYDADNAVAVMLHKNSPPLAFSYTSSRTGRLRGYFSFITLIWCSMSHFSASKEHSSAIRCRSNCCTYICNALPFLLTLA